MGPEPHLVPRRLRVPVRDRGARRDAAAQPLIILLSIEIMLNGANLALITFSRNHAEMDGQIFALAVMAVAASEVVVGLG